MGVSKLQGIGTLRSAQKYRYPVLALSDGDLPDTIHQRVDREQGTTDDYANEASHDNHEDRLNHGRNIVDLLVELVFIDLGGFAEHLVDFTRFLTDTSHLWD